MPSVSSRDQAINEIVAAYGKVAKPGAEVTPQVVQDAAQLAGMNARLEFMKTGGSPLDAGVITEYYDELGRQMAALHLRGGPKWGTTVPAVQ